MNSTLINSKSILWADHPLVIDYKMGTKPDEEEACWEREVYPLGNGRLGCAPFGGPARERIQFNQESLWVGNEDNTGGYQPFGEVYVEMPHEDFDDYRRELDISRSLQTITYRSGKVKYKREYFSNCPSQLMVFHFSSDRGAALSGKISMGNIHGVPVVAEEKDLVLQGDTSCFWWWQVHLQDTRRLMAGREYVSDEIIRLDFEARLRVINQGGSVRTAGNKIVFEACDSLVLLLAAETNYVMDRNQSWLLEHPHKKVMKILESAEKKSFSELLDEHISDYRNIFDKMDLDLGETPVELKKLQTGDRVEEYSRAVVEGRLPADRDLEVLMYQYARYLMISSSRSGHGGLPSNLQGLWLINIHPFCRCDYHTDVNIQMNYWFATASNLHDCFIPFARWVDSIREVRKEETRKVLGVERGWLMRSENGIFGGSTWQLQKGDSAWLCQNLWEHFSITRDIDYLEQYAYPVMKEISEFWIDHLKELPDGRLVAPKGRSPEHGPADVDGVTYDQVLCWDLFNNTIEASEVLSVDPEFREKLRKKKEHLLVPQIGKWGQLQEWMDDIDDPRDDHRHMNHLICVYPGRQVHPELDQQLANAAKVSIQARFDHSREHPGWSRVWKSCIFARLLDGEMAFRNILELMKDKVNPNLWTIHPPFQIDSNFGYAAAVNEMLVQSHLGSIHLLPALPKAWSSGSVKGLCLHGGYELELNWKDNSLVKAMIRGVSNDKVSIPVKYREVTLHVDIKKGETVSLDSANFEHDSTTD